jgi:hypothetical protein
MTALRTEATVVHENPWVVTVPAVNTPDPQREAVHEATYRFVQLVFGVRYAHRHFTVVDDLG